MIRVAFISRGTLYSTPGGDTKQIDLTAHYLRQLGVQADIYLTHQPIDYSQYDLLHFFNIIRPADIISHAIKSGKPFVVSTIFLDFGSFEKNTRGGAMKLMNKVLSEDRIEYIKVVARRLRNGEKIMSPQYIRWGHRSAVKWVMERAAILLPNSESEYKRLAAKYEMDRPYHVVPNGIDANVAARAGKHNTKYEDAILCVARIEGRKNQLNLIRALKNTEYKLIIHGKHSPNHEAYYQACRAEAGPNVQFSEWLSEDELYEMYHSSKVHVLASFFETTGLSSLEAAVMGCNIVITDKGDTRDYFGDNAWYCNPDEPASIKQAIDKAFSSPYDEDFRQYILQHYTWKHAAAETLKAYKDVLA
jgi:glycosyltransferase involved in cell wall biosynthesis